jgi:hypothetical protein
MDTNKIAGKDVAVYISDSVLGTFPVGCDDTCDIEVTTSMITTTTKCSKDPVTGILWDEIVPNINGLKITGSGLVPLSNSAGYDEYSFQQLASAQFGQKKVYVTWGIAGTNLFYGADGYITTSKATAAYNDVVKYNYTIQVTGKPTTNSIS